MIVYNTARLLYLHKASMFHCYARQIRRAKGVYRDVRLSVRGRLSVSHDAQPDMDSRSGKIEAQGFHRTSTFRFWLVGTKFCAAG